MIEFVAGVIDGLGLNEIGSGIALVAIFIVAVVGVSELLGWLIGKIK